MTEFKNYLIAKGYSTRTTESIVQVTVKFIEWIKAENLEIETISYNDITAFVKKLQERNIRRGCFCASTGRGIVSPYV